jgi:23S rRNA maturation-related 3'-5' exoribonuclease YhaM
MCVYWSFCPEGSQYTVKLNLCCSILIYQDDPDEHAEETHMLSTSRTLLGMYFLNKW